MRASRNVRIGDKQGHAEQTLSRKILIVTPVELLKSSLRFLFEEERYIVTTASSIAEAARLPWGYGCTVLDGQLEQTTTPAELAQFVELHWPVVMLVEGGAPSIASRAFRHITKPMLGPALSHAVLEALSARRG